MKRLLLCALIFGAMTALSGGAHETSPEIALAVDGGAGNILEENFTPEREKEYRETIARALQVGHEILANGGNSLDAVEAAVRVMEDSPLFNAGRGAVFTSQGKNEMDASIMDGATLDAGAVASVTTIKNPVSAARKVMENSKHVMLVGRGAEMFAAEQGLEMVDPEYFFTQRRWESLLKAKEKDKGAANTEEKKHGTAGAVALDLHGGLAAATSTGGLTNKLYGRVGDSPILGAGTYANNATCAVSSTGQGEYFMRGLLAYEVSVLLASGDMTLEEAGRHVIHEKLTGMGGEGGIIAVDKDGNVTMTFNTPGMYRGYIKSDGVPHVFLFGEDE